MKNKLVSVIIPTRNSADFLEACLKSVESQTYKNIEVIIVDNNSADETEKIARKYTSNFFICGPERSAQINYGTKKSSGEFLYRVDSDFELREDVVRQCVEKIESGCDAVVVHNTPDENVGWLAKVRKFEVDMYKNNLDYAAARFVKRDVSEKIGGYGENITAGEDYDFQNKLNKIGAKTGFVEAEAKHLGEPKSFWSAMKKYYDYGKDFVNYRSSNKVESKKQLGFLRPVYFKNWRKFISHPALGTCFVFYHFCKFGFGAAGYYHQKLKKNF